MNANQSKEKFKTAVSVAAQMLVSYQSDCITEALRNSDTVGGAWLSGKAQGGRSSAKFILSQLAKVDSRLVAKEISDWATYYFKKVSL